MTRSKPQRSCSVCRVKSDKSDLIRVVRSPEGRAVVDIMKKLPGRGAYICPDSECIMNARKSGKLAHALGAVIDDDFWRQLEEAAGNSGTNAGLKVRSVLGLSRKSGLLIIGSDNIERERRKMLVLMACDCSEAVREFARKHECMLLDMNTAQLSEVIGTRGGVQIVGLPLNSGFAKKLISLKNERGIAI
ncbi:MAG: DUF448 domain-containing protein [Synergistaceae bacterium]|nr:DUF448 domain-containing protein [Synergistaceae bacterium]